MHCAEGGGATPSTMVNIISAIWGLIGGGGGGGEGGLRGLNKQNCRIFAHSLIGILFVTKFSHFPQMVPFLFYFFRTLLK